MCNICFRASSLLSARQIFSMCDGGLFYRSHAAGTARRLSTEPAHFHLHFSLTALASTVENWKNCSGAAARVFIPECVCEWEGVQVWLSAGVFVCIYDCECMCCNSVCGVSDCVSNWKSQRSCEIPVGREDNYIAFSELGSGKPFSSCHWEY